MEDNEFLEFCRENEKEGVLMLIFALLFSIGDIWTLENPTLEE